MPHFATCPGRRREPAPLPAGVADLEAHRQRRGAGAR
jgi:hypothetical protein